MEKHAMPITEGINELTKILAGSCLRRILRDKDKDQSNSLKYLDKSRIARNELDVGLTAAKNRRKI